MQDKIMLPELVEGKVANAVRIDHSFDKEMRASIDKNREHLRKYLFWVDYSQTLENTINTTNHLMQEWDEGKNFAYAITDKNDSFVGSIDIHNIDRKDKSAQFTYWLSFDKSGNGYVSDILPVLEEILFEKGFAKLIISCDTENVCSKKVAIRNGYELEKVEEKSIYSYGEFRASNNYAKLAY